MNQTKTTDDSQEIFILKSTVIWFSIILGLLGNIFAFRVMYFVKIGFPATRMLLRLQFIWDGLGCTVLSAYWVTFNLRISLGVQKGSLFRYLWSSYFLFWFSGMLSSINILLLSFDRYWAIIWFQTYSRESMRYKITLLVVLFVYTTIVVLPSVGITYCIQHLPLVGLHNFILIQRVYSVFVFLLCYLIPAVLITLFQLRILCAVGRIQTNSSSINHVVQPTAVVNNPSVRDVTIGILIILITFLVIRSYAYFQYMLVAYGWIDFTNAGDWRNEGIFVFVASYVVDPFTLIFTSRSTRNLLLEKVSVTYSKFLHAFYRVFKIDREDI
ncbi:hypothetical protein FBUS_11479 [Fasciolopsis buskii]|uniref:G-protein coupled receptors family 1 profile domain-containing protein n=1 Tax=Fasciolopsis buskii TaxID=27845 RepID=A0A8E0RNY6_9TREM|nr:hypothetical protein FBUS_11479 [Fasciolopsis buski]